MTNKEIVDLIYERVCGTCDDAISRIQDMIETGEIDEKLYYANELEILGQLDSSMFYCDVCGWNFDMGDISLEASNMGSSICSNCEA